MSLTFSLEFFPPKTQAVEDRLKAALPVFAELDPSYVTVTYGAGGSTKEKTREMVLGIDRDYDFPVAAHLTAVDQTKEEVLEIAEDYYQNGIRKLVVLRGDPIDGNEYTPHPDGFAYALDLVEALKDQHNDFDIIVAAYAEGHPEAPSLDFDLDNLKRKLDAGASSAVTQFFFDPELYLRFRDRAAKAGIEKEIAPGLLPVLNFANTCRFAERCGAPIPQFLHDIFTGLEAPQENHKLFAMNILSHQITRLALEDVKHFHFYTLNETLLTQHICRWLKIGF